MTAAPAARDVRALLARVVDLERESADERARGRILLGLAEAFTAIARTRNASDAVAVMLRAAFAPLGFGRAIYFGVDREREVRARFAIDRCDAVEPYRERAELRPESAFVSLLREAGESVGRAGELSAPLVDVRGWYAASALVWDGQTRGILYVDDHRKRGTVTGEAQLVGSLAAIAAVAIERAHLLAATEDLANRDPLTGILNRRGFSERLRYELTRRAAGPGCAYVLIDVDDFKAINDANGHPYGDAVLRDVARVLVRSSRAHDVVGRLAGDEFVALLTDVDAETAHALVARLSADFRAAGISASLGATLVGRHGNDVERSFAAADRALYAAKARGKNGYSFA